jgi:hypothetical protein
MARVGENTHPPDYENATVVQQPNKSLKKDTQAFGDTADSPTLRAATQKVTKDQRKTGRVG